MSTLATEPSWNERYGRTLRVNVERRVEGAFVIERRSSAAPNARRVLQTEAIVLRAIYAESVPCPLAVWPVSIEDDGATYRCPQETLTRPRDTAAQLDAMRRVLAMVELIHQQSVALLDGFTSSALWQGPQGVLLRRVGRLARMDPEGAIHDVVTATQTIARLIGLPGVAGRDWEYPEAGGAPRTRLRSPPTTAAEAERALLFAAFDALSNAVYEAASPEEALARGRSAVKQAFGLLLEVRRSTPEAVEKRLDEIRMLAGAADPGAALEGFAIRPDSRDHSSAWAAEYALGQGRLESIRRLRELKRND